jgi:Tfp pilus assembly protein PilN
LDGSVTSTLEVPEINAGNHQRRSVILTAMRTSINLSSRPFTNHRLLWLVLAAVSTLSLLTIFWAVTEKARVVAEAEGVSQRIEAQRKAFEEARAEEERRKRAAEVVAISEGDAYQLAAARLLIDRKSISWTRILSDLENYVPKKARITSLKVDEIGGGGPSVFARLEVKALGSVAAEMTEMMSALDKSGGIFEVGEAIQEGPTDTGEIPFTLNLTYRRMRGEE